MRKEKLINESMDYIMQHVGEDLSVDDVADHFHFSKHYFCRMFKEVTDESVYAFIKRLKMNQSAVAIKLKKDKSITDIGLDYGYSASNYSSAFRKHHHISPAEFRKSTKVTSIANPFYSKKVTAFEVYDEYASRMSICEMKDVVVVYERFIGNYIELKEKWLQFLDTYQPYMNEDTFVIEKFYDDPSITELNRCICDLCITADEMCDSGHKTVIKGGKFAIYRYEGDIENIFCTLQGIFSVWMAKSGYEMAESYALNIYRKIDGKNGRVVMDLCIPIK